MIMLYIFIWWLLGFASFVFWWTTTCDLDIPSAIYGCIIGVVGPIAFILGFIIHGNKKPFIFIKSRGKP